MSRAMVRWTVAGALALAAVGVMGGTGPLTTAEAAPSVSPFAGSYAGSVPGTFSWGWNLVVSRSGGVTGGGSGSGGFYGTGWTWTGTLSGSLRSDGLLKVTGHEVREYSSSEPTLDQDPVKVNFKGQATLTRQADGTLTGMWTDASGGSWPLTWYPQ
jgi:hypothetical protein